MRLSCPSSTPPRRAAARREPRALAVTLARVKLTVTVITLNEAANIEAALASVAWADEIIVVDSGSTDDTVAMARRLATRVEERPWPGYGAQKNYAARSPRTTGSCRSTPTSGSRRSSPPRSAPLLERAAGARLPHPARDAGTSGAGSAAPTGTPTTSCGSTIGAPAGGTAAACTSRSSSDGTPGRLRHELQHFAYRDISRSPGDHRSLHHAGRGAVARGRPPHQRLAAVGCTRRSPSSATTSCAAASPTAAAGLLVSALN